MKMIGDKIREQRKKREWTQEQLGEMVCFSQSKISKIENGGCDSLSDLRLIVAALEIQLAELMRETEREK